MNLKNVVVKRGEERRKSVNSVRERGNDKRGRRRNDVFLNRGKSVNIVKKEEGRER